MEGNTDKTYWQFDGLTNKEYRAMDGITATMLKSLLVSPQKYIQAGAGISIKKTPSILQGLAMHSLLLEPDKFHQEFAVREAAAADEELRKMNGMDEGKEVLSATEMDRATEMARAAMSNTVVRSFFAQENFTEQSFFWIDEGTGLRCKCRTDQIVVDKAGATWIIEYKSTKSTERRSFERDAEQFGYQIQAAHYMRGVETVLARRVKGFLFVAVQNTAPYSVEVYYPPESYIIQGYGRVDELLSRIVFYNEFGFFAETQEPEIKEMNRPYWA